jgi:aminoglycoside phosphotransferase (APT) family kinase protein
MSGGAADPCDLVDRDALDAFLRTVVPPYETLAVSLLSGGASNLTFQVAADDRRYVLRRRPLGTSAPRAHDMQREFTVIRALNKVDFRVPLAVAYSEDRAVVGEPFYLMAHVGGAALHTADDVDGLSADDARVCSETLVDTLAGLHGVDPVAIGLEGFGRPQGFLERRIGSWLRQWGAVEHRDLPDVERLGARLLANLPATAGSTLVHGDYRLGNVLFEFDPRVRLSAVLDWEMSTIGDPLTDLAHLLVYWEPTCGRVTHASQLIARHDGFLDGAAIAQRYAHATGRDVERLGYYLAFEHWRAAIIKDAIYLRAVERHGAGLPGDMVALGDSVSLHLEEAGDILGASLPAQRRGSHVTGESTT